MEKHWKTGRIKENYRKTQRNRRKRRETRKNMENQNQNQDQNSFEQIEHQSLDWVR